MKYDNFKIIKLKLRWQHGCPLCHSIEYREDSYKDAILNGLQSICLTCLKCWHSESASNDSEKSS